MGTATTSAAGGVQLSLQDYCRVLAQCAKAASQRLVVTAGRQRLDALLAAAKRLSERAGALKEANAKDLDAGRQAGLSAALLDRLTLDDKRITAMVESVRQIAAQPDPVGQIIEGSVRPNGLRLQKVRVPLGVVLMIYESRPNVTCDAAALCLKSGNAVILRGGKEALHSSAAIADAIRQGIQDAGLDPNVVQLVGTTDRAAVTALLQLDTLIDLAIPRGGESLIRAVVEQSRIPVIKHYTGNCHVYIDAACDEQMAVNICVNAKTQRTGVCNAAESFVFHKDAAASGLLARIGNELLKHNVEIRGDDRARAAIPQAKPATDEDWATEYLVLIVSIRVVDSLDEAIAHINHYGSRHTDAIVTTDLRAADRFVQAVDSANVFVNCSTRFSDGGEYGLGAEIGISTDKLHARGPMGAADLTTYKWVAWGDGQFAGEWDLVKWRSGDLVMD